MVVGFHHVVDLHDVRVVYHLQDLYLSSHCLFACWLADLGLFVGFDGYFLIGGAVDGDAD